MNVSDFIKELISNSVEYEIICDEIIVTTFVSYPEDEHKLHFYIRDGDVYEYHYDDEGGHVITNVKLTGRHIIGYNGNKEMFSLRTYRFNKEDSDVDIRKRKLLKMFVEACKNYGILKADFKTVNDEIDEEYYQYVNEVRCVAFEYIRILVDVFDMNVDLLHSTLRFITEGERWKVNGKTM